MSLFTISGELISFLDFFQFVPPLNFVKIQAFMKMLQPVDFSSMSPTRGQSMVKKKKDNQLY